jgi:glycosyltransferase involved in cell wall biosynthesis
VKPSVSILSYTLSHNAFGRAWVLAELLGRDFDVHIVAAAKPDDEVWAPVRASCTVEIRRWTPSASYPAFRSRAAGIARRLVTGDLIYAVKPRLFSFGLGLAARRGSTAPLVLDVDDWEVGFGSWKDWGLAPWALVSSESGLHTRILSGRTDLAQAVTVSSSTLYARYGGTWVPHARSAAALSPGVDEPLTPAGVEKTVVFVGTPRKHKGLFDLIDAFKFVQQPARLRLIGGAVDANLVRHVALAADPRISVESPIAMTELAGVLASASLVVIPQRDGAISRAQLPAKLLDAMAMGRPIVATRVGDIPRWLEDGAGILVEPGNPEALGHAIDAALRDPVAAMRMGSRARARFLRFGELERVRSRLVKLMTSLLAGEKPVPVAPFEACLP